MDTRVPKSVVEYWSKISEGDVRLAMPGVDSKESDKGAICVQGNVQGALYGIVCFTGGLGAPTFALVFALFSSTSSATPFFPGQSWPSLKRTDISVHAPVLRLLLCNFRALPEDMLVQQLASEHSRSGE